LGKSAPSPPPPPDPNVVAAAQTGSNVMSSQANTIMANANERGPLGNVDYDISGYQTVTDPNNGTTYQIPQYTRTQTLSPEQQGLYQQQTQLAGNLNNLALGQTSRIDGLLSQPISLDGLPNAPGDMSAYRQEVENALMQRMNPQLDRERDRLEAQMMNQGLFRGSAGFNEGVDQFGRQANDARTQAFLASSGEARAMAEQQAITRERAMQERLVPRNQSINEIGALMSGGQVTMPQFTPYRGAQMSETPVGQYHYQSADIAQRNWQAEMQANSASNGAIWGALGKIGAGMFAMSDRRLKRDIRAVGTGAHGLTAYTFRYNWSDDVHLGYMADEVRAVRPDAVTKIGGFLAVNYGALADG
jgi:hypothetical protein